jgi:WD40 repeat protein
MASVGEYQSGTRKLTYRLDDPMARKTAPAYRTNLKIWDTLSGQEVFSTDNIGTRNWCVWWSPDGNFLATGTTYWDAFQIWDMGNLESKGNPTSILLSVPDMSLDIDHFWWTPDSRAFFGRARNKREESSTFFYGTTQNGQWTVTELDLVLLANRLKIPEYLLDKVLQIISILGQRARFTWATQRIACESSTQNEHEGLIEMYEAHIGPKPLSLLEYSSNSRVRSFAWSPDGTRLAYDLQKGHLVRFLRFSPEPTKRTKSGGTIWSMDRFILTGGEIYPAYLHWSTDGKLLAIRDNDVSIWQVDFD